jgi:hypothetical protein
MRYDAGVKVKILWLYAIERGVYLNSNRIECRDQAQMLNFLYIESSSQVGLVVAEFQDIP